MKLLTSEAFLEKRTNVRDQTTLKIRTCTMFCQHGISYEKFFLTDTIRRALVHVVGIIMSNYI